MTDPNALAAKAWEAAERAGEDAYIEAVQTGVASSDMAMAKGAVAAQAAIAAVYAPRLAELDAEVERLREALEEIMGLPGEINPSNYDHDDVCELNRQFCYGYAIARAALKDTRHD